MCAVSMITDHYRTVYPDFTTFPAPQYPDYAELVRKAKLYDEMTKQADCPDQEKLKWHEALEKFMREKYDLKPKAA